MAVLLEKLRSLFSSSSPSMTDKALPSYIRSEDPDSCWLTSDFIGDGAYGKIYKVCHTHPFNGSLSGTIRVSRYQKGKTNLDFTEARDSEWQWHQLGHMQVCTSLQTDNRASTPLVSFLPAWYPSCRPTNSIKALKAIVHHINVCQLDNIISIV